MYALHLLQCGRTPLGYAFIENQASVATLLLADPRVFATFGPNPIVVQGYARQPAGSALSFSPTMSTWVECLGFPAADCVTPRRGVAHAMNSLPFFVDGADSASSIAQAAPTATAIPVSEAVSTYLCVTPSTEAISPAAA